MTVGELALLDKNNRARRARRESSGSVSAISLPLVDSTSDSMSESSLGELEPFDDLPSDSAGEVPSGDSQLPDRANDSASDSVSESSLGELDPSPNASGDWSLPELHFSITQWGKRKLKTI